MQEFSEGARRAARGLGLAAAVLLGAAMPARAQADVANPADASGREALARRGCAGCHADLRTAGQRVGPDLSQAAWRLRPDFLAAYIAAPHEVAPDARMPDVLAGLAAPEREAIGRSLADFLGDVASAPPPPLAPGDAARGERLFHSVGCALCHGPRVPAPAGEAVPPAPDGARDLSRVGARYTRAGLTAFLVEPLAHRPAGLMPDMLLSRAGAADLAAYLLEGADAAPERPPAAAPGSVATGREWFEALSCGACHALEGSAPRARDVGPARRDPTGGCLAAASADAAAAAPRAAPDFGLDEAERALLRAALLDLDRAPTEAEEVARTLAALSCSACHERGGRGGVPAAFDGYLTTSEPDLGEPARVPPRLDDVGTKLQRTWTERVLLDGAAVRPYMSTRMPQFGADAVGHLPALLETVDAAPPLEFAVLEGEAANEARDAGRRMLGTTGLGCVTCHAFNSQPSPGFQGLDLITTTDRLQPRWFRDFLVAPQALLPGIVMPESWPGGEAVYTSILDGDTERQIEALWHFLKLGRSAPDPPGIRAPDWKLDVGDAPRVYRGRSRVAGFRGIAVGFPGGLSYAFDANSGALAAIWRGDFVSVNWNGQGAGDFSPRARAAALPRDLALRRAGPGPWPLRPVMTEEAPVNPDPTYPRAHGYRFRGYHVDSAGVPTLRYEVDGAGVEDRLVPRTPDGAELVRTLVFEAPAPTTLQLRALTGAVEALGDGRFRVPGLELRAGALEHELRPLPVPAAAAGDGAEGPTAAGLELLLTLPLPAGTTTLELTYERLP